MRFPLKPLHLLTPLLLSISAFTLAHTVETTATEYYTASAITANQLAFGGFTTPPPSPSPSVGAHTTGSGGGFGVGGGGGSLGSTPPPSSTNNPSNDGCGGCGGGRSSPPPPPSPSVGAHTTGSGGGFGVGGGGGSLNNPSNTDCNGNCNGGGPGDTFNGSQNQQAQQSSTKQDSTTLTTKLTSWGDTLSSLGTTFSHFLTGTPAPTVDTAPSQSLQESLAAQQKQYNRDRESTQAEVTQAVNEAAKRATDQALGRLAPKYENYGDATGQKLGQTYSGPKGSQSLNGAAYRSASKSLGFDVPAVAATPQEIDRMTRMVLAETQSIKNIHGGISTFGVLGVAEVIRNRVLSPAFPSSVDGVVTQHNAKGTFQFSPAKDNLYLSKQFGPNNANYDTTKAIVQAVLNGNSVPTVVTSEGKGMINYGNLAVINGQNSEASQKTAEAFNTMANQSDSITIQDASRPNSVQHTFGIIGSSDNAPSLKPADGVGQQTTPAAPKTIIGGLSEKVTQVFTAVKTGVSTLEKKVSASPSVQFATDHPILTKIAFSLGFGGTGSPTQVPNNNTQGGGSNATVFPTTNPVLKQPVQNPSNTSYPPNVGNSLGALADSVVQKLFAQNNSAVTHYATITKTSTGGSLLVRQADVKVGGINYVYELGSEQYTGSSVSFSNPVYLTLTRNYKDTTGKISTITYADQNVDGQLDYIYINDIRVDDQTIVIPFQDKYKNELVQTSATLQ